MVLHRSHCGLIPALVPFAPCLAGLVRFRGFGHPTQDDRARCRTSVTHKLLVSLGRPQRPEAISCSPEKEGSPASSFFHVSRHTHGSWPASESGSSVTQNIFLLLGKRAGSQPGGPLGR